MDKDTTTTLDEMVQQLNFNLAVSKRQLENTQGLLNQALNEIARQEILLQQLEMVQQQPASKSDTHNTPELDKNNK